MISSLERTTFAGRDAEWQRLEQCWQEALAGRRQVMLVSGEPGIGKSRLSLEFARLVAAQGAAVLIGRCDEQALTAYQPFVEAISHYAALSPDLVLARDVAAGATHLHALLPEIKRRIPDTGTPSDANAEGLRFRLFESVVSLASSIGQRQPLLLVVDDLHWADKPTLLMLRHLVRASQPMRLVVLGTYRDTEVSRTHPLLELLADLRKERDVTRLALRGLGEADVGRVVAAWTQHQPASALVTRISLETEGNPFFLVEVLQHLHETGDLARLESGVAGGAVIGLPEGVKETIGRRLSTLGAECGRLLSHASVIGREFPASLILALGDVSETVMLDALDDACRAGLLAEVPGVADRYSFTHALIRETLYDELSTTRRARAHLRVAEALERTAPHDRLPLADLALHYLLGALPEIQNAPSTMAFRPAIRPRRVSPTRRPRGSTRWPSTPSNCGPGLMRGLALRIWPHAAGRRLRPLANGHKRVGRSRPLSSRSTTNRARSVVRSCSRSPWSHSGNSIPPTCGDLGRKAFSLRDR